MKCDETLIEEYHYGELEASLAAQLAAHLRECQVCSSALTELEQESSLYRTYVEDAASGLEATPRMWLNVEARLRETAPRASLLDGLDGWWERAREILGATGARRSLAAFAALLVGLTVGAVFVKMYLHTRHDREISDRLQHSERAAVSQKGAGIPRAKDLQSQARQANSGKNSLEVALWSIRRAEQDYIDAIKLLDAAMHERREKLDPQLVGPIERNLRIIDQTIDTTRKAYQARPHDFDLARYMLTAYARKVEVLQELTS